ncbi:MAG: hypothetical protein WBP10_05695 [Thermoanaerobaculia bacterium]|jgi:hypothetical protein
MKRSTRFFFLFLFVVTLLLGLEACSSSGYDSSYYSSGMSVGISHGYGYGYGWGRGWGGGGWYGGSGYYPARPVGPPPGRPVPTPY